MQTQPSIQMTLFDYFMDQDKFTLNEAVEAVKTVKQVKEPSVRGRIYEGIDKGLFERVGKGVYTVNRKNAAGGENSCLLINGNGRDLSMFEDNSMDALITDHPYKLDKSLKGGNRDFADYERFRYEQKDMDEKCRVLKPGCFLVEFLPEENAYFRLNPWQCKQDWSILRRYHGKKVNLWPIPGEKQKIQSR